MIYQKQGELWCECGNRICDEGFHPIDKDYNYTDSDGFDEKDRFFKCDRCGQICDINVKKVPEKDDFENTQKHLKD